MHALTKRENKKEKYFSQICCFLKMKEELFFSNLTTNFNRTEQRMLFEILLSKHRGERLISTQIAQRLGVTRSAVSQMVMRMEAAGIVMRSPVEGDKKTAYVDVTDGALKKYSKEMDDYLQALDELVQKFGEERFENMFTAFAEFYDLAQKRQRNERNNKEKLCYC